MNAIRQTQLLNKRELENATPPSASWHADYRDTAYIYIGGLHPDLTEGDVVTIFSQFGNPTHLNLIRDKETGKSKGFGFLKYEDQRSCDLAVDNFTGADVLGRLLRVDHTRYKKKDDEDEDTHRIDRWEQEVEADAEINGNGKRKSVESSDESGEVRHPKKKRRHILKEERELEEMLAITRDGEEEDPMREYLIREKREERTRTRHKKNDDISTGIGRNGVIDMRLMMIEEQNLHETTETMTMRGGAEDTKTGVLIPIVTAITEVIDMTAEKGNRREIAARGVKMIELQSL